MEHLRRLSSAWSMYSDQSGGHPLATEQWSDALLAHTGTAELLACPMLRRLSCGYAANSRLRGLVASRLRNPENTVLLFESDVGWNAAGGSELLPDEPRHFGGDNYAFCDGTVRWIPRRQLQPQGWAKEPQADSVIWEPMLKEDEAEVLPDP